MKLTWAVPNWSWTSGLCLWDSEGWAGSKDRVEVRGKLLPPRQSDPSTWRSPPGAFRAAGRNGAEVRQDTADAWFQPGLSDSELPGSGENREHASAERQSASKGSEGTRRPGRHETAGRKPWPTGPLAPSSAPSLSCLMLSTNYIVFSPLKIRVLVKSMSYPRMKIKNKFMSIK